MSVKLQLFSYPSVLTCVSDTQKNNLNEMVLLSTHNIFCLRIKIKSFSNSFWWPAGCLKKSKIQFIQIIDSTLRVEINEGHNNAKTGIMPVIWNFSSRLQI